MKTVRIGIIGGGLMGREAASAFGRWFVLKDFPVRVQLTAVCDLNEQVLEWYKQIDSVNLLTTDYRQLISSEQVDVVYIAVPHNLHRELYIDILRAGKDLLGEKPFGIDLEASEMIAAEAARLGRFVRCSSEMPFLPGPQRAIAEVLSGKLGRIFEIRAGFLHASDMNAQKPINWKRQSKYCGEIGVMGDLGMHALHVPLRLGWKPTKVFAQLQKIITERPDGRGGIATCDTWNNAILSTQVDIDGEQVPMLLEMKRLAPGETNTWYIEIYGTEGGVKYSTKDTKTFWQFTNEAEQWWKRTDLGFQMPFETITGGIFEAGFPDCFMQMFAAYVAEREGMLQGKFGCATPEEAVTSHRVFQAALLSQQTGKFVDVYFPAAVAV
ncbi:Predicted dehydrogenase [Parapedobacter composti]|uniref:Predicted dehydrogenase n=1 Tax=Parapedobacter composti TaxID=623281 RepID=A0A1I1L4I8_9SPHI|nr:Gfo/Idh/MocA family oxidoreductase [Parapedobacter composti]SFC64510.1 Predicted dehydrogenase [Parapedobacter composti]